VQYLVAIVMSLLLTANAVTLAMSSSTLPSRVASHFDLAGVADSFIGRTDYLMMMTGLSLGVPAVLLLVTVMLPFLMPNRLRIPSRDYWIAPERRAQTLSSIATVGLVMSAVAAAFMLGLQLLVVAANAQTPPRMDTAILFALVAFLVVSILISQFVLWRRFQVAP
jgi:hypothetical protein